MVRNIVEAEDLGPEVSDLPAADRGDKCPIARRVLPPAEYPNPNPEMLPVVCGWLAAGATPPPPVVYVGSEGSSPVVLSTLGESRL